MTTVRTDTIRYGLKTCPFCKHEVEMVRTQWSRRTAVEIRHIDMAARGFVCHLRYQTEYENRFADKMIPSFIARWNRRSSE